MLIHFSFKILDQNSEQSDNVVSHKMLPVNEIGSTHLNSNLSVSEHSKDIEISQQDKIEDIVKDKNVDNNKSKSDKSKCKNSSLMLGKKNLFTLKKSQYTYKRQIKLLQNRMSSKKCRQKKKMYIESLEKELAKYKMLVSQYQQMFAKLAPLMGTLHNN